MKIQSAALAMTLAVATAFSPSLPNSSPMPSSPLAPSETTSFLPRSTTETTALFAAASAEVPPLKRSPPRNIALLIEPTPFTHVSGYANRFKEMLRYLAKAGDHVDILTVDAKTPKEELPLESFGYNIEHTQGFVFPLYDHISLTVDLPEMKGAKMMERKRPDLIHVTSPGFLLFAGLFYARVMRIPLLLSYHTHLPLYARNYLGFIPGHEEMAWALLRFAHSRADLTLVTSPQMKEEMESNGIPRVDVWRKGIDTVRFDPKFKSEEMRRKMTEGGNPEDFLMVYVGRLGAEKRLKDIRPVLEKLPNARLCIVGTGPQEDELKEYFKGTNTVFTGQLSGDELSSAFASADVFMMPSDSETLGFVVLESMASGVPVVGCAAGGIPDLIRDQDTGFLVQPGDIDGYLNCAKKLMDKKFRKQMGVRARTEAEKWGWEAATSVLRNVQYEKALINFHSRAFGGFGRPKTTSVWRLLRMRIARVLGRLRIPGFRRNDNVASPI
jgi:sulfoquinovosyltransferase